MHVAFWVPLVFAVLERIGITTAAHWNVDHLPEQHGSHVNHGDFIASLAVLTLVAVAVAVL